MIVSSNSSRASDYYELAKDGLVFTALASKTALVAFGTTTAIGGPLLWNNTGPAAGGGPRVMAVLLGMMVGWTTAPAAEGVVGIAVGNGQTSAPSSTSAITGVANNRADLVAAPQCNVYTLGTVANAAVSLYPTHSVGTTSNDNCPIFVPLDGIIQVPPGCWASPAGAAAISTIVAKIGLVWAEIPY